VILPHHHLNWLTSSQAVSETPMAMIARRTFRCPIRRAVPAPA
jgi:hypothetical protein